MKVVKRKQNSLAVNVFHRHAPPQPEPEQEEATIMIQPVMIPLVGNSYQTHMPQQAAPMPPQMHQIPQSAPMHPMEAMRPPPAHMMQRPQPQDNQMPPSSVLHHIAQQIIAQRLMDVQREQEEAQNTNELPQQEQEQPRYQMMPEGMVQRIPIPEEIAQRLPIPEEVLTQINRLPNRDMIVAVSEQESEEAPQQEVRIVQQPRTNAVEMNGRQTYARGIPVHIPVPMMQQEQPQEPQAQASEEPRPHCKYAGVFKESSLLLLFL